MAEDLVLFAEERRPWWRSYLFPLVPDLWSRQADEWNPADFSLHWLCFRVRSKMSPDVGFEATLGACGFFARVRVPYLYLELDLNLLPPRLAQRTWREGTRGRTWG